MTTPPAISPWPSLVEEPHRTALRSILGDLEAELTSPDEGGDPTLSSGDAGRALFLGYLSRLPGKEGLEARAMEALGAAVEGVERTPGAQFYAGFTGIAWTIEHLQKTVLCDTDPEAEDPNHGVDEVLLDLLSGGVWARDYDLISGLVGFAVYALERVERPTARLILARILDHLETLATPRHVGLSWITGPALLPPWQRELAPAGYLNLGLAHGVPGVLVILAALLQVGEHHPEVDSERAASLLQGGVDWLLSQFQEPEVGSYLGGWCPVDQERVRRKEGSRVAWCYGDLGVSMALLQVARLGARSDWEARALEMARLAAGRSVEDSGVCDAGLCHGSAGNALIFQRLFHLTGETRFRDAARMYLDHLLESRKPGGPFGGFTTYRPPSPGLIGAGDHVPDPGLLEGSAGVGLALLAALGVEPRWDRFMLLSLPELP